VKRATVLGRLSPRRFLARHWQREPLLVRGAFPGFQDPIEPEELAGLACEPSVSSRLVLQGGSRRPWTVVQGPLSVGRLRRLPATRWTLLVQQVDRLWPAVAELRRPFSFLPTWRLDDVMVSYAVRGGGVGPHVDQYDVFLVQGRGRRRWRVARHFDPALVPGIDLRVLRRFRAEQEWVLEPGDLLYLPPGVAHHGTALEPCLTYSIGFRAPSSVDLAMAAAQGLVESGGRERLFADPQRPPARREGEIDEASLDALRTHLLREVGALGRDALALQVGELLTVPRGPVPDVAHAPSLAAIGERLERGADLVRAPGARIAWTRVTGGALLFVDGRSFSLGGDAAALAPQLGARERLGREDLPRRTAVLRFVRELLASGSYVLSRARRAGR
jgi:50S ribosomal protein L16 3-hydroxylase